MDEVCTSDAYVTISVALFGDDTFRDLNMPSPILKKRLASSFQLL